MLRTHEEIQAFIVHPANANFLRRQLEAKLRHQVGEGKEGENRQTGIKTQRFLLKAVFGRHVFRGSQGRALKAVAEYNRRYTLKGDRAREIGRKLQAGGGKLVWAVSALDQDTLQGFSDREKYLLIHELKSGATYLTRCGRALVKKGRY